MNAPKISDVFTSKNRSLYQKEYIHNKHAGLKDVYSKQKPSVSLVIDHF